MPTFRKLSRVVLLFVCGMVPGTHIAFAQQPPADTTGVFGFLKPTYTSSYDITRQATNWLQSFSFKNQ